MTNILFKTVPSKLTWLIRIFFYSIVLIIIGWFIYGYFVFSIKSKIEVCNNESVSRGAQTLDRHKEIISCLNNKANFVERLLTRAEQEVIGALPSSPCQYVARWKAVKGRLTSSITLSDDGKYFGEIIKGGRIGQKFSGVWGVHDNKMIWLDNNLLIWPLDSNPIIDESAKGFTLVERDGSHTRYTLSDLPKSGKCAKDSIDDYQAVNSNLVELDEISSTPLINGKDITQQHDSIDKAKKISDNVEAEVKIEDQQLIADPLVLGLEDTLFLYENVPYAQKVNWRSGVHENIPLPFLTQHPSRDKHKNIRRYSVAKNKAGIWFVGPTLALRQEDGNILTADFDYPVTVTIGLNDESVLIFANDPPERTYSVYRARLDSGGRLVIKSLGIDPDLYGGFGAVKLVDGRVLVVGGQYTANESRVFNPLDNTWKSGGKLSVLRSDMGITGLPDGRAIVVGSGSSTHANDSQVIVENQNYGVEIWDPVTNGWRSLPRLPLSFRVNAYKAIRPSVAVLPDGSLVVAGAMHRHVLLLKANGKSFAGKWDVIGTLPKQRVSGIVQALGNNEVVVSGGVGPWPEHGQCCKYLSQGDRISWKDESQNIKASISINRKDSAVAHRNGLTFAAGGWVSNSLGNYRIQSSARAEIINQNTKKISYLSHLPQPMMSGKAIWLDSNQIAVKANKPAKINNRPQDESIFPIYDKRSVEVGNDGYLAIYDLEKDKWKQFKDSRIDYADMIGKYDNALIMLDEDIKTWSYNVKDGHLNELPQRILSRNKGFGKILDDGRIVVAGGYAQTDVLEVLDADCNQANCPKQYFGQGELKPSVRFEVYDPTSRKWQLSQPSHGAGENVVILKDGRVLKLGHDKNNWKIESSKFDEKGWSMMPWPDGLSVSFKDTDGCGYLDERRRCALVNAEYENTDIVAFIHGAWDAESRNVLYSIWLWMEAESKWQIIDNGVNEEGLMSTRTLPIKFGSDSLKASYFMPNKLRVWQ